MRNYDAWLTTDPNLEIPDVPDEGFCPHCEQEMDFEPDVDCDEETGKAYYSGGGSWNCTNKACPPEKQDAIEE